MEDKKVKVVTLSELLRSSRPVTATSSLQSSPSTLPRHRKNDPTSSFGPTDASTFASDFTDQNPNPKILVPIKYPAIIVGTITLPTFGISSSLSSSFVCTRGNCFVFSDGSSGICCDVLNFDVRIVGKKISVVSWNFIPFKHSGGFLEIIKWSFLDSSCFMRNCSSVNSFPLVMDCSNTCKDDVKAPYLVYGAVESISPILVVPCKVASDSQSGGGFCKLNGYLLEIMACECKLCKLKMSVTGLHNLVHENNKNDHCFNKRVIVYFCGFATTWHPAMAKLVGTVVLLSGLKKKLVYIGNEVPELMYITTEKSFLHLPKLGNRYLPSRKTVINGKGECAAYTGIVKNIYMQGMVVELDKEVWLLLTDQALTPPHSLRVGALISVKNVHFVNPKFSWTEILILGACSKTNVNVEIFSPLQTGAHVVSPSQSLLMKYIDSLPFSARLWVLLVVSCFHKKFAELLTEQEILGSKHKEGLVQQYASSKLPSSLLQSRPGLFMEFCRHGLNGCGGNLSFAYPKLVLPLPISYIISINESLCKKTKLYFDKDCEIMGTHSCKKISYSQSVRDVLSRENRSIVLLGILKISPSSGKLQLVDGSGGIDVLVPDLPLSWHADSIYEVNNYELVIQGISEKAVHSGFIVAESFSCRHIFQKFPIAKGTEIGTYAFFHLQTSTCNNQVIYPSIVPKDDEKHISGTFHLLRVTHKFPLLQKFDGDPVITNRSTTFAEAIVLPWDLFLNEKDTDTHLAADFEEEHKNASRDHGRKKYQDHAPCKRHKVDRTSTDLLLFGAMNNLNDDKNESCGFQTYSSLLKVPCLATITVHKSHCMVSSGILYCPKVNKKVGIQCETNARKVLLEFKSESYVKYQLLQIGGYYVTKCSKEDLCITKGVKFVVTFETYLWSLSFSPDEASSLIDPSHNPLSFESLVNNNEVIPEDSHVLKLSVTGSTCDYGPLRDVNSHISVDVLLKIDLKDLKDGLIMSAKTKEKADDVSRCADTTMTLSIQPSGTAESGCLLPEGNLVSLNGHVVSIHNSDYNSLDGHVSNENLNHIQPLRYTQASRSSICIYLSMGHHIVRILGNQSKHTYPVGFGPGVDAAFYRILQLGQCDFILTPVSYIVISSIRVDNGGQNHKNSKLLVTSNSCNTSFGDTVSSGLISDILQCSDCGPISFCARVLAIHVLILEKSNEKYDEPQQSNHTKILMKIPLAGFILDDGSTVSCCWASDERAATFLRLYELITLKSFGINQLTGNGRNRPCKASKYHVDKVLQKHDRITMKNHGSIHDSSFQDLIFSVGTDGVLSSSDENLLKTIIFNACFGTILTCQGKVMDSNASQWVEKHLTKMGMPMLSLPNIWVTEVYHRNTLSEARSIIDELQNR